MDWEKLEVLMTVLDEGSLTGAAESVSELPMKPIIPGCPGLLPIFRQSIPEFR